LLLDKCIDRKTAQKEYRFPFLTINIINYYTDQLYIYLSLAILTTNLLYHYNDLK